MGFVLNRTPSKHTHGASRPGTAPLSQTSLKDEQIEATHREEELSAKTARNEHGLVRISGTLPLILSFC